ncbi:MAG: DUF1385 domain-containing protein [Chloroflexi bacterium]|nr:DUF1385 domain-containing protein [Chloroflexota bacterium]
MAGVHRYGGQALIEGVMIRGERKASIAVRCPNGEIALRCDDLNPLFTGRLRRVPLIRGVVVLIETVILGMSALNYSANVALEQEGHEVSKGSMVIMLLGAFTFGIALFFLAPLFAARGIETLIASNVAASNLIEGTIRLALLIGYITLIGLLPDIRRVFAYHGAEHMTVHAQEDGVPLEVPSVRNYPTAHPRCGTAFLLVVMVIAVVVFALLGRPSLVWSIVSRILLVPVIAGISYEIIRFSGYHSHRPLVRLITAPSLALQRLTTRQPEDSQIEVAIQAMKQAIDADKTFSSPATPG